MININPLELNFLGGLGGLGNERLMEQILRMSMQDRGRTGTPPASE